RDHAPRLAGERRAPADDEREARPGDHRPRRGGARMSHDDASFAVGIDLGTTHCAVSYVDLDLSEGEEVAQHVLPIPQVVSPGSLESLELLPSFLYLPQAGELPDGALSVPWEEAPAFGVGAVARELGAKTPIRVVSSAKSWL